MTVLHDPVALIQKNRDAWTTPYVELDIFATESAQEIVDIIDTFCQEQLGSRRAGYLFHSASVGSTHGVQLADRREVVIKARPPASTNPYLKHDRQSLETMCQVLGWLHARAYPCPKVLLGPLPLGQGLATVEAFFAPGVYSEAFQPDCRRTIACGLAERIAMLRSFPADVCC